MLNHIFRNIMYSGMAYESTRVAACRMEMMAEAKKKGFSNVALEAGYWVGLK